MSDAVSMMALILSWSSTLLHAVGKMQFVKRAEGERLYTALKYSKQTVSGKKALAKMDGIEMDLFGHGHIRGRSTSICWRW